MIKINYPASPLSAAGKLQEFPETNWDRWVLSEDAYRMILKSRGGYKGFGWIPTSHNEKIYIVRN